MPIRLAARLSPSRPIQIWVPGSGLVLVHSVAQPTRIQSNRASITLQKMATCILSPSSALLTQLRPHKQLIRLSTPLATEQYRAQMVTISSTVTLRTLMAIRSQALTTLLKQARATTLFLAAAATTRLTAGLATTSSSVIKILPTTAKISFLVALATTSFMATPPRAQLKQHNSSGRPKGLATKHPLQVA